LKLSLALPLLLALSSGSQAQTVESIEAILASVRAEYAQNCKTVEFGEGFAEPVKIDSDRLDDLLVDYHELLCDGSTQTFCGAAGCDMILYIQNEDRTYRELTAFFGYGVDFDQPHAQPPSFVVALHGNECGRSGVEPCSIRYKIEGDGVVEVGEVSDAEAE